MEAGKNAGLTHEPKNGAYTSGYGQETSSYPPPVGGAQYPPSGYPAQQTPQQQLPPPGAYPPPPPPNAYAVPSPQPQYAAYPPQYPAPQNAYPAQQYAPNPPVILGGAATVLDTPTNVIVGEASDSCMIQPRNTVLMVVAIVAAVGAVIAVINLIVSFSVVTLVAGIIALGIALGCAFFCHDVVIEFNKSIGTFRLMHRRFLFVLCDQRDIKLDVPFSSLGEPYAESSGPPGTGALATVWLPVQGHPNVKLAAHHYHTDVDLQRDLMVWRVYVNRFRGPVSAVSTLMHAVHGAASGLTSAIRATV